MTAHAGRADHRSPDHEVATGQPPRHEQLGPYRIVQRLGEGGMGVVHLALDRQGRAVAIKVLRPHIAYDPEARTRLEREVDTLSRIRDERVATIIDADIFGERPYLVTRYVAGPSLDEVVDAEGPLRGDDLLRLGRGLVGALEAIHGVGVVHRDLKPGNVLLEDGEPVVIDFGIAHVADDVRLTSVGLVMGTPGYLSPEVVQGALVTEGTDWWGWAATLAFAATGRPPFGRGPMDVVLDRVRRGQTDLTGIDPRLLPLLTAALSPDPAGRPPAGEVVAALERYAAGGPATVAVTAGSSPTSVVPAAAPDEWWEPEPLGWDVPLPDDALTSGTKRRWGRRTEATTMRSTSAMPQGAAPAAAPAPAPSAPPPFAEPLRAAAPAPAWAPHPDPSRAPEPWTGPSGVPVADPTGPDGGWGAESGHRDPRIDRPLRTGTLVALVTLLAAAAASWPGVVALLVVLGCWVARFGDRTVTALVVRRYERGVRRSDVPRAVVTSPWHVVLAAVATVAGLVLPAVVAVSGTVCASLAISAATGGSGGPGVIGPSLAAGFLAGALVAWWGPGGASLRRGTRSLVRGLAPSGVVGDVVVAVLVVGALALAITAFVRGDVTWWPFPGDPTAGLHTPLG